MNEKQTPAFNIGITLIVLVFMSLCLLIFAVLSLENAVSDRNLTNRAAEHTKEFYEAYSDLEEYWSIINKELLSLRADISDQKEYRREIISLAEKRDCQIEEEKDDLYLICRVEVSEYQNLLGKAKIIWDRNENNTIEIVETRLEESGQWNPDRSIQVYKGE